MDERPPSFSLDRGRAQCSETELRVFREGGSVVQFGSTRISVAMLWLPQEVTFGGNILAAVLDSFLNVYKSRTASVDHHGYPSWNQSLFGSTTDCVGCFLARVICQASLLF